MSDTPKTIWIETRHIPDNVALDKWDVEPDQNEAAYFTQYTRTDSIPSQDALICAALEAAAERLLDRQDSLSSLVKCGASSTHITSIKGGIVELKNEAAAIRALADNPDALAAIKAKAGVRG